MSRGDTTRPLRRSLFFVPGGEPRKLEKARSFAADTLLFDLEDSVSLAHKDHARELVAACLREGDFGDTEPAVRINPPGTPYFEQDLDAVVAAGAAAIMLPKSESAAQLTDVAARVEAWEARAKGGSGSRVRLLALVETAGGVADAVSIAGASPRLDALCFGHADFSRDMALSRADASQGVLFHARCQLAIAARARDVAPIDTVYLDVRDEEGFRRDAELGASLGFEGKLCIHPSQVAIANDVYSPTAGQVEYAQRVLAASREAAAEGRAVFTVDGKMVDAPLISAQERVIAQAIRAGLLSPSEADHDS